MEHTATGALAALDELARGTAHPSDIYDEQPDLRPSERFEAMARRVDFACQSARIKIQPIEIFTPPKSFTKVHSGYFRVHEKSVAVPV